jgi:hypothetical protein
MLLAAGYALLILGLAGMLLAAHLRSLRFFDRPSLARLPRFDPILDAVKWLLVAAGLGLIGRGSLPAAVLTGAALAALWGYRAVLGSTGFRTRRLKRDFEALRRRRPDLGYEQALFELAWRRHPRWGPELIEQMVRDYPAIESFAVIVVRMERGFRGFRTTLKRH